MKNTPGFQRALRAVQAEADLESRMGDCRLALRSPDRFEHLVERVSALPALKRELTAVRLKEPAETISIAKVEDRAAVYRAIFCAVNGRDLMRCFPTEWCDDRTKAVVKASKALRSLRGILARSPADPGLLLEFFAPVEREFLRFLRDGCSERLPYPKGFEGRGQVIRELLTGSPKRFGWVKGGRPRAIHQSQARADLRELGVKGEALEELIEVAGLKDKSPRTFKRSSQQPRQPPALRSRRRR